ncbi:MAG: phosphoribosylamine--glycine ligase [Limnochordales bacterium]|nr:phosphoribosylamine--glycine ligase [Limnochordales bacterium]
MGGELRKVLVVGGGGREDALGWALSRSTQAATGGVELWFYPGNAGTLRWGRNLTRDELASFSAAGEESERLTAWAVHQGIDLAVIGPEAYLAAGLADRLRAVGVGVVGPGRAGAQIESSKAWAKKFMTRHGIPTARYRTFTRTELAKAREFVKSLRTPPVIKADGLAGGKGVTVTESTDEALQVLEELFVRNALGEAGNCLVIEERMTGREVSLLVLTDGHTLAILPEAQDHKRIGEGDTGPNTGGMGAYSPVPFFSDPVREEVIHRILLPTLRGLAAEGIAYRGVIYAGLMLTADGPKVVEFNCRFGDPETQVILPRLEMDWLALFSAVAKGNLDGYLQSCSQARRLFPAGTGGSRVPAVWQLVPQVGAALAVVIASEGYPGSYQTGFPVEGLAALCELQQVYLFHAGTRVGSAGRVLTAGGRVLNLVGVGESLAEARARAYEAVARVRFANQYYRRDIGYQVCSQPSGTLVARRGS